MNKLVGALGCGIWAGLFVSFATGIATPTVFSSSVMALTLFTITLINLVK